MEQLSIHDLKKSQSVINDIRWDVTPRIFFNPSSSDDEAGKSIDITYGYMLYVDIVHDKPALIIMQLTTIISKTVGYIFDIPEDLLRDSMHCSDSECVGGMYPLTEKLEGWLKKEFGLF